MSLSLSRGRRVKCFGSYHDDLCIFSVPLICWLKQESWLGRKCYHSRVNNILQILCQKRWAVWISVGSWAIKLLHEIPISALGQLAVDMLSPMWARQITVFLKKREYTFFSNHSIKTRGKICELSYCPVRKCWFFPPTSIAECLGCVLPLSQPNITTYCYILQFFAGIFFTIMGEIQFKMPTTVFLSCNSGDILDIM